MSIIDTAFYKYLIRLSVEERTAHLYECLNNQGEMFFELADEMNEYSPYKLSQLIEDKKVQNES